MLPFDKCCLNYEKLQATEIPSLCGTEKKIATAGFKSLSEKEKR